MKVLSIAHNAVAASNRRRIDALAALPDVERVALLTPRWWPEEGRVVHVPPSAPWLVGRTAFTGNGTRHVYLSHLFSTVRTFRPDVIDLFEEPFSLIAFETLLARDLFAPGAALVFYSAVNVERRWRLPYRWIERLVLRRADGAHGPNADVPRILRARGLSAPCDVIPLGVDLTRFPDAPPMPLEKIARPRIGFLGRLEPVKGLEVLLAALDRMTVCASLVVAGDGPLRQQLAAREASPGPPYVGNAQGSLRQPSVHVLGALPYEAVPAFLKAIDVLVLPSVTILPLHREQFGRVLAEAMAAGVPVVGSNSGAIPEVIGDAGLVVPERDPAALASALDRVLSDAPLRTELIARGHERALRRFAWPAVAEQTLGLFRSAMLHRRRALARLELEEERA